MRISDCSSYVCSSDLLCWPDGAREDQVPSWLVFSGMIRTVAVRAAEPGARPFRGALDELGFEDIDAGGIIAGFGRHLMAWFHEWTELGFAAGAAPWLARLPHRCCRPRRLVAQK